MKTVSANGLDFKLDVRGEGPRLLFIGGTGWDLRVTPNPLTSTLPDHFAVAFYDQRGMGQSAKPPAPYTMLDYARDAVGILDALGWASAHIVGYSFGGMVAQEVAIGWTDRVDRLVLAATSPGGRGGASYPIEKFLSLSPYERARCSMEVSDTRFDAAFQAEESEKARRMVQMRVKAQTRFIDEDGARAGLEAQLMARAQHDAADRLHLVQSPTLIVSGDYDGQASMEGQSFMADTIQNASLKTLPGSHNFIFENVGFYEEVASFCGKS